MAMLLQINEGGGVSFPLQEQRTTIGRDRGNDIILDDELVSKEHAVIEVMRDNKADTVQFIIQDLKSTNHTFVNDQPVDLHKLKDGDIIRIGMSNFRFVQQEVVEPGETAQLFRTWIPGVFYTGKKKEPKAKK